MKNHFLYAAFIIITENNIVKYNSAIIILLPYSRNNLTSGDISSNCDYETKHSEASVKNFCLRCKSEFHFSSP